MLLLIAIKRDGKDVATLPAQNYYQNPGDKTTLLFTGFSLKPKEDWAHIVCFLNYFQRADEKKYRSAEASLKADILSKLNLPENKDKIVEADAKLVPPFVDMFNQYFVWQPGEYELTISVDTSNKTSFLESHYRFTLYESDSNELMKAKDDFKTGDGINWDSGKHLGVIVPIVKA